MRYAIRSILVTLAVWLIYSWPLPRHLTSAIPDGSVRPWTEDAFHPMEPGDHLQLLYHCWLFSDFVAGQTPWFYNLYEFNTGNDAERFEPGSYYFPFSLFFTIGNTLGGLALGWNLAGFISLWLTFWATWKLARRYTDSDFWSAMVSLIAIVFPYRWINMAGGSPTGFGMMWVPVLMLGLDRAVRDADVRGGLWAGFAILMASWGDAHTFYFAALMIPCWCLVALLRSDTPLTVARLLRIAGSAIPVPVFAAAAFVSNKMMTKGIATSHAHAGRKISEIALFSPRADGLYSWTDHSAVSGHVYIGYALTALIIIGIILFLLERRKRPRESLVFALLVLGIVGIVMLSLGPFSPFDGRPFTAARKFIPQYTLIRQPAKVFCLLPSVLAVAAAMVAQLRGRSGARLLLLLPLLACLVEFKIRFKPVLCPLDREQAAYRAVAELDPDKPRALVLPLWPGDSHYTSVYEYYASLYHIRLANGYRPFVPADYIDNFVKRFESANLGYLDDDQLDRLSGMGIRNIILHEDLFPEKVSPFPVSFTLRKLLNHPRLTLTRHDGTVWAFHIAAQGIEKPPLASDWTYLFSARSYLSDRLKPFVGGVNTPATRALDAPDLRWMLHARGPGDLTFSTIVNDQPATTDSIALADAGWQWKEIPLPKIDGSPLVYAHVTTTNISIDSIVLAAGPWPRLNEGESMTLPAPCFFHAGYTDLGTGNVVIRQDRERRGILFYGPKLPLEPGSYRMNVDFGSDAPAGTELGLWYVASPEGREIMRLPVKAGQPLAAEFRIEENLPLLLAFQYRGGGNLQIHSVTLTRLANSPTGPSGP